MKMLCRVAKLCLIAFFAFHAVGHAADTLISPDQINFPPLQFNPPAAKRVVLENGIVLFVIEDHEIPLVRLSAVLRAGSNYDPAGKEGTLRYDGRPLENRRHLFDEWKQRGSGN